MRHRALRSETAAAATEWLIGRPIAHRGLHDQSLGLVENSCAAAAQAIAAGYGIECDVQRSLDGEAMVFHDAELARLTGRPGAVAALPCQALVDIPLAGSGERIPSLPRFLEGVAGRVPLICEIKSRFDGDLRLADRVAELAAGYAGPLAFKSFDPAVVAHLRSRDLGRPLGIVAEARFDDADSAALPQALRQSLVHFLHFDRTRPDFVSYCVDDLPHAAPHLCRTALGLPVLAWTVRTEAQRRHAMLWADQIVFEALRP